MLPRARLISSRRWRMEARSAWSELCSFTNSFRLSDFISSNGSVAIYNCNHYSKRRHQLIPYLAAVMFVLLHNTKGVLPRAGIVHLRKEGVAVGFRGAFVPAQDVSAPRIVVRQRV